MARPPRDFASGLYHVASQASDTRFLFSSDAERELFLDGLATSCERFELGLVTYTLMGTHYHLILFTPDARLSTALQRLHSWYSRRYNKARGRSAHLFRAHFFSRPIMSDADLLGACRYVARNPVEAGLVRRPLAWPWSGARANVGLEKPRIPLDEEPLRAALSGSPTWRDDYRALLEAADEPAAKASQPG
jgi:REP element-mobilizing transposase RayT